MSRLWAWWNTRAAVGGASFLLLRFAIFFSIPILLVVILAIVAQAVISGR
jgi:hypothetical protein